MLTAKVQRDMTYTGARDLFDQAPIPGLRYHPDLLTREEERRLTEAVARLPFAPFEFQGWQGRRRVVSFGWRYDFKDGRLEPAPELPAFLLELRSRAAALLGSAPSALTQCLVTEYAVGAGIGWHRDRPVFAEVVGVSLLSSCLLRFRRRDGRRFQRATLLVEPGSAYVLRGEARETWEHSIAPVEALRYSITFRSLRTA